MHQQMSIRIFFLSVAFLAASISSAIAYETYSTNGSSGNCASCHGDFRDPYVSLVDGVSWGNDLHDVHRSTMLNSDCAACHYPSRSPVYLDSSTGSNGFNISCNGCHGRAESAAGGQVIGAGLRQHHWNSGVTVCFDCHDDSNPLSFTTVAENTLPPYYFTPDTSHPNKPTDPCNPGGEEDFAGTAIGLDNDGDGFYDLNDGGCQTAVPDINLNPVALNFGSLLIGNGALLDTRIENLGDTDLTVANIAKGTGTSTEFTFTGPTTPFMIAAGGSQSITVAYQPMNTGTDTGSLIISSDDPDEQSVSLSLSGTGIPVPTPDINLSPPTLTIGSVLIGDSRSQDAVIQNLGTAALTVSGIAPGAGTSAEFSFTAPTTPLIIAGGGSRTITVTYQPVDAGADNGTLVISSNDPDEPDVTLNMSGTGDYVPTPDIDISPATVTFPGMNINETATQPVTIQNLGTAELTVNVINRCQGTSTEYSWLPDGPFILQAKSSLILTISYTPLDAGIDAGCFTVSSDDPDEALVEIGLQGKVGMSGSPLFRFLPAILNAARTMKP